MVWFLFFAHNITGVEPPKPANPLRASGRIYHSLVWSALGIKKDMKLEFKKSNKRYKNYQLHFFLQNNFSSSANHDLCSAFDDQETNIFINQGLK